MSNAAATPARRRNHTRNNYGIEKSYENYYGINQEKSYEKLLLRRNRTRNYYGIDKS